MHLAEAGGGASGEGKAVRAGEVAADEAAEVERIRGHKMQDAKQGLHPDEAAQQVAGVEERERDQLDVAVAPRTAAASSQCRGDVGDRAGKRHHELAGAMVGEFLAFRVGVREEATKGKQHHGAQAKSKPCCGHQSRGLANNHGEDQNEKERDAARPMICAADADENKGQHRKEEMHAHLHARPTAQRNRPASHTFDCSRWGCG